MSDLFAMLQAAAGAAGEEQYQISRSLRFNSADSASLTRTPASAGNRKTFTWSGWVKRTNLGGSVGLLEGNAASNKLTVLHFSSDALRVQDYDDPAGYNLGWATSAVFRDVSAWYHIVFVYDSTQASSSNAVKIYVNGVQQSVTFTAFNGSYSQNRDTYINATNFHVIGEYDSSNTSVYANYYLTEVHFVDGQALTPSDFGETDETTGVWKPKAYTGTYGTNGFYLNFSDNTSTTTLGEDQAGSNDWTLNNFSVTAGAGNDSMVDTPTPYGDDTGVGGEVRGNYATINPLGFLVAQSTVSNGNLAITTPVAGGGNFATFNFPTTGKWYAEYTCTSGTFYFIGIIAPLGSSSLFYYYDGQKYISGTNTNYGATYGTNDIIGVAVDCDSNEVTFYKNGVSQGAISFTVNTGDFAYYFTDGSGGAAVSYVANFGQRPFAYTAPSGFKTLCTQNLPTPTVVQGDDYFNTVIYSGTSATQNLTVGFQPDWVWIKKRSAAANHILTDAVRGNTKQLRSNETSAESTITDMVTAFSSTGVTLGADTNGGVNATGSTYVAWNWNAGGSNATNTDGTITSTVRANPTAGFSIFTWSGTDVNGTIGHGLGAAPAFVMVKNRNNVGDWRVWHKTFNGDQYLKISTTDAVGTQATLWNSTVPNSTVISAGTSGDINWAGRTYVGYAFAEIEGFSKFGSYTGNGSADGPFVYCGFRPAWLLVKRSSSSGSSWIIWDAVRNTYNVMDTVLAPDLSSSESTLGSALDIDFTSNGYKLRNSDSWTNQSTATYIFMAFAENPFKYSLAR